MKLGLSCLLPVLICCFQEDIPCVMCPCCVGCLRMGCQRLVVAYPITNIFFTFIAIAENAFKLLFIVAY
jgi:hypothetical protein